MRLIRFGNRGEERPEILDEHNTRRDVSDRFDDWDRDFFNNGGMEELREYLAINPRPTAVSRKERWRAPIARPGKVIYIGLNYSDHARESHMAIPEEPIVFQKGSNTVVGPYDPIIIPRGSENLILTGTPAGVGLGMKPPRYLKAGDVVELRVDGLGEQKQVCEQA